VFFGIGTAFEGVANANAAAVEGVRAAGFSDYAINTVAKTGLTSTQFAGKVLAHAVAGGVMNSMQGGKFGHGFASAGITQAFAPGIDRVDRANRGFSPKRVIAAAVVGGTASVAGGGKFANGAMTAAFSRAHNGESHRFGEWIDEQIAKAEDNLARVELLMRGDWRGFVRDASIRVGWTSPKLGIGSGTLQMGFEQGRFGVDMNIGWGAAQGIRTDVATDWVGAGGEAQGGRVWFGGNVGASGSLGPLRARYFFVDEGFVVNGATWQRSTFSSSGFDASVRPSSSISLAARGGAMFRIGFISPNVLIEEK
jgi:hypothetical protein